MDDKFSDFQTSLQTSSNILFPVLLWYLEFIVAYVACIAIVTIWKLVQKKFDKN